jgi:hypothetical protein
VTELDLAVRWCGSLSIVGGRRLMTPVARAFALTSLVTTAAHAAATTPWTRVGGSVRVSVDATSFAYSAALLDGSGSGFGCGGFADGGVAFRCRGVHYTHGTPQPGDATLVLSGAPREGSGADSLGEYDSIAADWQGGSSVACALHTEIRYYPATASFVFVADFSEDGVPGTNATAPLTILDSARRSRPGPPEPWSLSAHTTATKETLWAGTGELARCPHGLAVFRPGRSSSTLRIQLSCTRQPC